MRTFYSLLALVFPAFLLAQNNCQIFDLTATAVDVNGCQFYVQLDFQHQGTTNQFMVQGAGVNYGTFPYSQDPLTLGPFTASPNAATTLTFLVRDAVFGDCADDVAITVPPCAATSPCEVYNVTVEAFDCNPATNTYHLLLDFDVSNPGNDFFEVWSANGTYLGLFPLSQLPLTLPNFPWNGQSVDLVKICINDQPNCCRVKEFPAPACAGPCPAIQNLAVQTGACNPADSTYALTVNFTLNSPALSLPFVVYANGTVLDTFNIQQLPLTIPDFPWNGGPNDKIRVCLLANIASSSLCCAEREFPVPPCLPIYPCSIQDFVLDPGSCTSDSTFSLFINFEVGNPATVDSFTVQINGQSYGTFAVADLPLQLPNVEWNGQIFQFIRVATGNLPTCVREMQFMAPDCLPFEPCHVSNILTQVGPCTSDSTYRLRVNFQATNPGNGSFVVWANGVPLDTFALADAPVQIDNFPWGGSGTDVVSVCVLSNSALTVVCCAEKEVVPPPCLFPSPCQIVDFSVQTGPCSSNNTYAVTINFETLNPVGAASFAVWANGQLIGTFPLSSLPLTIPNFPWNGGDYDHIKVCLATANVPPASVTCCVEHEFLVPDCLGQGGNCDINDLNVETGDCTSNTTYEVWVNFAVSNPPSTSFQLFANGAFFGTFNVSQLPLHITNFPYNGGPNDVLKVCFGANSAGTAACCETVEFEVPDCLGQGGACDITNLNVDTGDCNPDGTYNLWLNFTAVNPPSNVFSVIANGQFFGNFELSQLPLHIEHFPYNGGPNDVVQVCFPSAVGAVTCCEILEFPVPPCAGQGGNCDINDLNVETGDCTSNTTYEIWVNFAVANPPSPSFVLFANGVQFGTFNLSQLPLHITNFPYNGGPNDVVKVCFPGTNSSSPLCCETVEFPVPPCLGQGGACDITNLTAQTGACNPDGTYHVWFNFTAVNPPSNTFTLIANGQPFGTFNLGQLPLHIEHFPYNGGPNDVVQVCFVASTPAGSVCCETLEFPVPPCAGQGGNCDINDLNVETGDCTSNTTYEIWVNFAVSNPPSPNFVLFANGVQFGTFNLNQLPLHITNFPYNGGPNDVVKVCFPGTNSASPLCCETVEFPVPDCLGQGSDCHIYDLHVTATPCICGQFFALVTFGHENGDSPAFDILGNGVNYGTYLYNHAQPIVLGPLAGGTGLNYEFIVRDHENHDCQDEFTLGVINCVAPPPSSGHVGVNVSPNPTVDHVVVNIQWAGAVAPGASTVEVFHADGRRMQRTEVPDGTNFRLDVAELPAALYRLVVTSAVGRVEGTFAKQ